MTAPIVLRTEALTKSFNGFVSVAGLDFALRQGDRRALIGPNGAGKTTFINLLTGVLPSTSGRIWIGERDVTAMAADRRVKAGIARTFQINQLLRELTVIEHVQMAVIERLGAGNTLIGGRQQQRQSAEISYDILEQLRLDVLATLPIIELSYGRQRLVEIAIALALEPSILLLDEPAAGVPPAESFAVFELIERLPSEISVLFIEHDMKLVARFASWISVLVAGSIVSEGTPKDIAVDPIVREIYLGRRRHA